MASQLARLKRPGQNNHAFAWPRCWKERGNHLVLWCGSANSHGSVTAVNTLHFSQGTLLVSLLGEEEGAAAMTSQRWGQGPTITNP
ncbi:hypothetical protein BOTNAR_0419g00040 [Botryotinia narcissicola]|uniref:Uncharacterized protein n=1 Tax=Botryotinia narcissicola TaxID=278944 RepID=A0A4Z1HKU6_9HELO|nr:hypothetical protein BOTNAR_0419g00040 [Botryotinia narcissicola]